MLAASGIPLETACAAALNRSKLQTLHAACIAGFALCEKNVHQVSWRRAAGPAVRPTSGSSPRDPLAYAHIAFFCKISARAPAAAL